MNNLANQNSNGKFSRQERIVCNFRDNEYRFSPIYYNFWELKRDVLGEAHEVSTHLPGVSDLIFEAKEQVDTEGFCYLYAHCCFI